MHSRVLIIIGLLFSLLSVMPADASTTCSQYPSNSQTPTGYGLSWDPFSPTKEVLVRVDCSTSGAQLFAGIPLNNSVGGPSSYYTYKLGYVYTGGGWQQVNLEPSNDIAGSNRDGDWISGRAESTTMLPAITSSPTYVVGYVCTKQGGAWKCGCTNASCSASGWQLQAYKDAGAGTTAGTTTGGGAGAGSTGATAGFPEIKECGSTQNVSSGSLSSAASADGCRVIVAAPGSYSNININGHTGGVVTVKCQTAGACTMGGGSEISNSNGVILDGFKFTGSNIAVTIGSSDNVLVRNSAFIEQTGSGVLINPGGAQENIQVYDNLFKNDKTGCQYGTSNCSGHLSDGSPVANMDYGVRVYDAKSIAIRGNTFGSVFNHGISLKNGVQYALIEDNTFNSCGRHCVELGQQTDGGECIEAMVRGNSINGTMISGVLVERIQKTTITGNTFDLTSGSPIRVNNEIKPAGQRTINQSGNTIK